MKMDLIEAQDASNSGINDEPEHDQPFTLNKRGQVRPKRYISKNKRLKLAQTEIKDLSAEILQHESGTEKSDVNPESAHIDYAQEGQNRNIIEETVLYPLTEKIPSFENIPETVSLENKGTNVNNPSEEVDLEEELISFIKEKETTSIDDLLTNLMLGRDNHFESQEHEECNESEDDETDDDTKESEEENSPLLPGHSLTLKTFVLMVWMFSITHSLTSVQLSDMLTLISLIFMDSKPVFKSLYRFKRFFQVTKSSFINHFYCSFCFCPVDENETMCSNKLCAKNLEDKRMKAYFLELPVETQLENMFSRNDFRAMLNHRKTRIKTSDKNMEDIYDSELYRKMSASGGPLSIEEENNLSFTFNTDGIPIFKSSKMSIWPMFLMINELPFRNRKYQENMLLCGLWFGPSKPVMNYFSKPLHNSLLQLERGIDIHAGEETIFVQGFLFCVTCDIPARSIVLNMNQHNGEYCCPKCLHKGSNHRTDSGGNIRVFPYQQETERETRFHQASVSDSYEAINQKKTVNGIKGPSFLMFCPQFDCVENIGIDYMHMLFLGSMRLLVNLWFGISNSLHDFSMYKYIDIVDARISSIKPPHYISRVPRTIADHLKFWKAAEFRSWFFFYSIPCIMDILQPKHFYHYCALVEAIFLLNQSSISDGDIQKSDKLLNYFVFMMPVLYGERYMTINIHSLLHLPRLVKQIGPLWTFSCFAFESANGELLKLFHGTQYIDVQMINAVHVFQFLPSLTQGLDKHCLGSSFLQSMRKSKSVSDEYMLCSVYGKGHVLELDSYKRLLVCGYIKKPMINVKFYGRANIRGIHFRSMKFSSSTIRNSYTVKYLNEGGFVSFGSICWFAFDDTDSSSFACILMLEDKPFNIFNQNHDGIQPDLHIASNFMNIDLSLIHFLERKDNFCIVPLEHILKLCVCIERDDFVIVCEEPNHYEYNL